MWEEQPAAGIWRLEGRLGGLLQMPESSPTAKQLASLLNETERTASGGDASIGGRTFILGKVRWFVEEAPENQPWGEEGYVGGHKSKRPGGKIWG
jgi:hypothetical protein